MRPAPNEGFRRCLSHPIPLPRLNSIPPTLNHLPYTTAPYFLTLPYLLIRSHGALPTEGRADHLVFMLATALMVWVCWTAASRYWSSRLWEGNNHTHGRAPTLFFKEF
jgi:hypothetical protein